jgi:hypothetical protein
MVVDQRFLEKYGARSTPSVEKMAGVAGAMTRKPDREGRIYEARARNRATMRLVRLGIGVVMALAAGSGFLARGFLAELFGGGSAPPAPASQGP